MRVLVVEDDRQISRQLEQALGAHGYVTDTARNGEDARFLGQSESYDAIVLDLGLPVLDGISVLQSWRQQGLKTPVLVLTARSTWSEKVKGLRAGADDYLATSRIGSAPRAATRVSRAVSDLARRAAPGISTVESGIADQVAETAQGLDEICAELLAQAVYQHLDHVGVLVEALVVNVLGQLRLGDDGAGPVHEIGQQATLQRGQHHGFATPGDLAGRGIQLHFAASQQCAHRPFTTRASTRTPA